MTISNISNYAISEDALTLRNMLVRVLDTVVGAFEAHGVPLPARQYWTFGRPAEDCEQVVVSFLQSYLGNPGDQASEPQRCTGPRSAVLNISVTRQFPIGQNGKAVNPERIQEANEWNAVDTQVLLNTINDFDRWDDFGPGLGVIATVNAADAGGGMTTVNMNLTMGIG